MLKKWMAGLISLALLFQMVPLPAASASPQMLIDPQFEDAKPFENGLAWVKKDGRWGMIDRTGNYVLNPRYHRILRFNEGTAFDGADFIDTQGNKTLVLSRLFYTYVTEDYVFVNGLSRIGVPDPHRRTKVLYGAIDREGNLVIDVQYDYIGYLGGEYILVQKNGLFGSVDRRGREVIPPQYAYAEDLYNGLARIYENGRYGLIDLSGKELAPPKYDELEPIDHGLARVKKDGLYGIIDRNGKEIVTPKYTYVYPFQDGLVKVMKDDLVGLVDINGKEVVPPRYDVIYEFHEGLSAVLKNDRYGFIDATGKEVIPLKYSSASSFSEGYAVVSDASYKQKLVDKSGKEWQLGDLGVKYSSYRTGFQNGLLIVESTDHDGIKKGLINKTGRIVTDLNYHEIEFRDQHIVVERNDKFGLLDRNGKVLFEPKYDHIAEFSEGLAAVMVCGEYRSTCLWGFIDEMGKEVIPLQYNKGGYAPKFQEGAAAVYIGEMSSPRWGYLANPLDLPSTWAEAEVNEAVALNLVPVALQTRYSSPVTRAEFSQLVIRLLEVSMNQPMDDILQDKGLVAKEGVFQDTEDRHVLTAHALGIVNGRGNGVFDPDGFITRQEAAVMLTKTAQVLGMEPIMSEVAFDDVESIAGWAKDAVAFVTSAKDRTNQASVMGGTGNNQFHPTGTYTREQAIITVKRLYHAR